MKLHELISRGYKSIKRVFGIQVLRNDNKWEDVTHFSITVPQPVYEIKTATHTLKCSGDHILIKSDNSEVFAKDSLGQNVITDDGTEEIVSVRNTGETEELFDLSLAGNNNTYFTNGFLSHNCLILDEFAFVPNNITDALFTAVYPVVSSSKNGKVIIVSTPNGKNNLYYDTWKKANNKNDPDNIDGWKPFRMDWWQVPGRDEKWKQAQIAAIGKTRFAQEFGNEFLDDVQTTKLISDEVIDRHRIQLTEFKRKGVNSGKNLFIESKDKKKQYPFTMYRQFDPDRTYLASADVAEGVGKDSSVFYVWDVTDTSDIKMCLKFSDNQVSILEFAYVTIKLLELYCNPYLACESNGIGLGYIEQLRVTYGYDNLVRMNKNGGCGIDSHVTLKSKACLWFRDIMTTVGFGFELYDPELLDEFPSFVKKDTLQHNVYAAVKGSNDDHVMAMIWMCWILNPANVENYFTVTGTFTAATGQLFAKGLKPQFPYTPSETEFALTNSIVKDFQIYKDKNESILNGEKKSGKSSGKKTQPEKGNPQKTVLSEKEVIEMMRRQTRGDDSDGGYSLNGSSENFFFASTGNNVDDRRNFDPDKLNVVWEDNFFTGEIPESDNIFGIFDYD